MFTIEHPTRGGFSLPPPGSQRDSAVSRCTLRRRNRGGDMVAAREGADMQQADHGVPIDAQQVDAPLSQFAVFLVVTVRHETTDLDVVRGVLAGLDDLAKTVGFRVCGRTSRAWPASARRHLDRLGLRVAPGRAAAVHRHHRRWPPGTVDAGRPALPHPRRPGGPLLRVRAAAARRTAARPSRSSMR